MMAQLDLEAGDKGHIQHLQKNSSTFFSKFEGLEPLTRKI